MSEDKSAANETSTAAASESDVRFTGKIAGRAKVEAKVEFDLDDATVFNLNRGGIKITMVTEN